MMRRTGRRLIDLYGFFGSLPVGFNHPYFDKPEVKEDLLRAAKIKVANSGYLFGGLRANSSTLSARVVGFAAAGALFLHRRRRARGRKHAQGGDGLESAQKYGGWPGRTRHARFCISATPFTVAAVTP